MPLPEVIDASRSVSEKRQVKLGLLAAWELEAAVGEAGYARLITEGNWQAIASFDEIDVILVELPAQNGDALPPWYPPRSVLPTILRAFRDANVPVIGWCAAVYENFADVRSIVEECDHVFCSSEEMARHLGTHHKSVHVTPPCVYPARDNPYVDMNDEPVVDGTVLSVLTASEAGNVDLLNSLKSLVPFGLRVLSTQPQDLADDTWRTTVGAICTCTTRLAYTRTFMKHARFLVQSADEHTPVVAQQQLAVRAAAHRMVVLYKGELAADDPRVHFARQFATWSELRMYLSIARLDPLERERIAQAGWRHVHQEFNWTRVYEQICAMMNRDRATRPGPLVTVITEVATVADVLESLRMFRAQAWRDRELLLIMRNSVMTEDLDALLNAEAGERIYVMPLLWETTKSIGEAAALARGKLLAYMHPSMDYGIHYLTDLVLHGRASKADLIAKRTVIASPAADIYPYQLLEQPELMRFVDCHWTPDTPVFDDDFIVAARRDLFVQTTAGEAQVATHTDAAPASARRCVRILVADALNAVVPSAREETEDEDEHDSERLVLDMPGGNAEALKC